MDKQNISDFVNYRYQPLTQREMVTRLITVVVLSAVCCLLGNQKLYWGIGFGLFNILLVALAGNIYHMGICKKNSRFLWDGSSYLCISVILCLISYRILTWTAESNGFLLLSMILFLILSYIFSGVLVVFNIRKGRYSETNQVPSKSPIPFLLAALGFLFAKGFLSCTNAQNGAQFIAMSLLFISVVVGLGWTNLIRLILFPKLITDNCE